MEQQASDGFDSFVGFASGASEPQHEHNAQELLATWSWAEASAPLSECNRDMTGRTSSAGLELASIGDVSFSNFESTESAGAALGLWYGSSQPIAQSSPSGSIGTLSPVSSPWRNVSGPATHALQAGMRRYSSNPMETAATSPGYSLISSTSLHAGGQADCTRLHGLLTCGAATGCMGLVNSVSTMQLGPAARPLTPAAAMPPVALIGGTSAMAEGLGLSQAVAAAAAHSPSVYVKNLPPEESELSLYRMFATHGAIQSCKILTDPQTGRCRGVGFVNYKEHSEAVRAIQHLNGMRIGSGRCLQVALQAPRPVRAAAAAAAAVVQQPQQ